MLSYFKSNSLKSVFSKSCLGLGLLVRHFHGDHAKDFLPEKIELPNVSRVIAVSSCKGGVGKSTVATNLAVSLGQLNLRVGLLDLDIYGPSIPMLLGTSEKGINVTDENKFIPIKKHGISSISIGNMIEQSKGLIWRGPLVSGVVKQLLNDTDWGELDYLVLDLPPGTGDTQITLAQTLKMDASLIVTTPQRLALADVIRGVEMFKTVEVPVAGIVENMSWFRCPNCNTKHNFMGGHAQSVKDVAAKLGVKQIAQLPFVPEIAVSSDRGVPVTAQLGNQLAQPYFSLANRVIEIITELRLEKEKEKEKEKN
ncbi:iron-sulfur protein nubpl [Anaeramoeba flamelloides]|uniref:Iron-sulfur protein nubpl n=1 Tax=Anaeramoeba flamelloides TaxID=1746091 RepID=A0ABQ8Z6Y4_9EUKA|nr:iron-sulfur protein nubpl [Anaeramoeba flamelloides]